MALLGSETRDALCSTLAGLGGCGRWAAAIGRVRVWKWVPCVESEGGRLPRIRRVKSGLGRTGVLESGGIMVLTGASSNQVAEGRGNRSGPMMAGGARRRTGL